MKYIYISNIDYRCLFFINGTKYGFPVFKWFCLFRISLCLDLGIIRKSIENLATVYRKVRCSHLKLRSSQLKNIWKTQGFIRFCELPPFRFEGPAQRQMFKNKCQPSWNTRTFWIKKPSKIHSQNGVEKHVFRGTQNHQKFN